MQLTFRRSLALAFMGMAALAFLFIGLIFFNVELAFSSIRQTLDETLALNNAAQQIPANVYNARRFEKDLLLRIADPAQRDTAHKNWTAATQQLAAAIESYKARTTTTAQRDRAKRWEGYLSVYNNSMRNLWELLPTFPGIDSAAGDAFLIDGKLPIDVLIAESQAEANAQQAQAQQAMASAQAMINQARYTMVGSIVGLLLCTVLLVWLLPRLVLRPIQVLTSAATQAAAGDMRATVPVKRRDELGQLGMAFNTMLTGIAARQEALHTQYAQLQSLADQQQQLLDTIADLATPLIPLTEHMLLLPLVGYIGAERAEQILSTTLQSVHDHRARVVLVDISGVPLVDPSVLRALIQLTDAVRLLGTRVLLIGVRAEVAQTLVSLDMNLDTIETAGDLQSALDKVAPATSRANGLINRVSSADRSS